jgi:hypothetical protein
MTLLEDEEELVGPELDEAKLELEELELMLGQLPTQSTVQGQSAL